MNTLQTIYNKLADKTELTKHEVELGVKEDVSKLVQVTTKIITSVGGSINQIGNAFDKLINTTKLYQVDKKNYIEIKKEFDFINGKFNQTSDNLKNNISNSDIKIKSVKEGQSTIKNTILKVNTLKNSIEQSAKELGLEPTSSPQYAKLNQVFDDLDILLENSSQALVAYEKEINVAKTLIK
jgi:hypothetical protein